ncbi:zinc-containing alcohol dehydrogenase [Sparganum proliferum]
MGSPISGFIAEAVLQRLESLVFQNHIPKFWTRYEDDTFILIERCQVLTFQEHLHTFFPDIQFTMEEEENNQLAFLYVLVCRKDCGGLKTKVFRKATNTMQALNFNSNHPISHKRCCVRTLYRHVETYYNMCEMPIERGPCKDDLIRYGYDRETGKCKKFSYGGCGGNENIFLTQTGCDRSTLRCSSNASVDICNIPIRKGRCRASLERYGYNSETGKCKKFIFGGCDGNENNFHSKKECEMASRQCSSNDICEMPIERGPCKDDLIRYGYDRETGKCKKFSYGGCGGNENIFLTQTGCERSTLRCSSNATVDICNIPIKKGRCRASLERYGYNSETGKCKKFIFGGCDGNENNFHSKKECEMASRQCSSNVNGYPRSFIRECRRKTTRQRSDGEKPKFWLAIPYVKNVSEATARILNPFGIGVPHKPESTIRQQIMRPKDPLPATEQSAVVYSIPCQNCNARYVGETGKRLCTRLHEHQLAVNREDKLSLVYGHMQQEKHSFAFGEASVLGRTHDKMVRLVLESWSSVGTINRAIDLHPAYQALRTRLQSVQTGPTVLASESRLLQQLSPSQQGERASRRSPDQREASPHRRAVTAERDSHMQRQLVSPSDYDVRAHGHTGFAAITTAGQGAEVTGARHRPPAEGPKPIPSQKAGQSS